MRTHRNKLLLAQHPDGKYLFRHEKRLAARCKRIFDLQKNWVIDNIKKYFGDVNKILKNASDSELEIFISAMPHKEEMAKEISTAMSIVLFRSGKRIVKQFNLGAFGVNFDESNKVAQKFLADKKSLELSNYRGNIDTTTKNKILEILRQAIISGTSYTATADLIREQGKAGVFSRARGELIAIQEIGAAYGEGNFIPMMELKSRNPARTVEKKWLTVGDMLVRPAHTDNEKQNWIDIISQFNGTGDKYAPSRDFNCRCVTQYRIL